LFSDGIKILEERGEVPVLGVVPYLRDHGIAEEDAATIGENPSTKPGALDFVVIHLPHISNFDDFDSLRFEPDVQLRFVSRLDQLGQPDVVLLPGTKNTLEDLRWLVDCGLAQSIRSLSNGGINVVGLCGGFQMLGREIIDEKGVESGLRNLPGLGLLPVQTYFGEQKTLTRSKARIQSHNGFFAELQGQIIEGYEIHMGQTEDDAPLFEIVEREGCTVLAADGACSQNGKVWGSYLHGVLDNDNLRRAWLKSLGAVPAATSFAQLRERAYDNLADTLEAALDIQKLDHIIKAGL
jgi:adenosylcobyric acid synthase